MLLCLWQALVGDRIRDAYRSGASKQQRGALVGPLWEEARAALVGQPHPGSSNGAEAASGDHSITALDVDQAMKVRQLFCRESLRWVGRAHRTGCELWCTLFMLSSVVLLMQRLESRIMRLLVVDENLRADGR